jgi:hypothetical protein
LRLRRVGVAAIRGKPDAKALENDEIITLVALRLGESGEVIGRGRRKTCSSGCRGRQLARSSYFPARKLPFLNYFPDSKILF